MLPSLYISGPYSPQHIQSAAHFARLCFKIESNLPSQLPEELKIEHRSYATACIFASVAFLEAIINELFADAERRPPLLDQLNPDIISILGKMWRLGVPRTASYSIQYKFAIALTLAGKEIFDRGANHPYQDVSLLIKLRNALIHYEPESVLVYTTDPNEKIGHKFEGKLKNKFTLNPLVDNNSIFFPEKCLGHGCARWAVQSSVKFVDEFSSRMGYSPLYQRMREKLNTE